MIYFYQRKGFKDKDFPLCIQVKILSELDSLTPHWLIYLGRISFFCLLWRPEVTSLSFESCSEALQLKPMRLSNFTVCVSIQGSVQVCVCVYVGPPQKAPLCAVSEAAFLIRGHYMRLVRGSPGRGEGIRAQIRPDQPLACPGARQQGNPTPPPNPSKKNLTVSAERK